MNGGGDGVLKALVGIGSEVDNDVRARSHGARDLNIEQDFGISAVGVGRVVGATVEDHISNGRRSNADGIREIISDVRGIVTTAELDDADGLTRAAGRTGRSGGKVVDLRDLRRNEGTGFLVRGGRSIASEADLRRRNRAVVEAKHG